MISLKDMLQASREMKYAKLDNDIVSASQALLNSIMTGTGDQRKLRDDLQTSAVDMLPMALSAALAERISGSNG